MAGTMHYCPTCDRGVHDAHVFAGAEVDAGYPVHAVDTGPGHHEIDVHRVEPHKGTVGLTMTDHRAQGFVPLLVPAAARVKAAGPARRMLTAVRAMVTAMLFWADVSYYQSKLTDSYNRRMVCFRLTFSSTLIDPNASSNLSWCLSALARARIIAFMVYHVWYPGTETQQLALMVKAGAGKLGPRGVLMFDIESWSGKIKGDHSTEITAFITACVHEFVGGNTKRVVVYGNAGDLANIYPHRPAWLTVKQTGVARYSSSPPTTPWGFWQYTDGSTQWPVASGFPRSSGGVGSCDHNVAYTTEAAFLTTYGLVVPVPPKPPTPPAPPALPKDDLMRIRFIDDKSHPGLSDDAQYLTNGTALLWLTPNDAHGMTIPLEEKSCKASHLYLLPIVPGTPDPRKGQTA